MPREKKGIAMNRTKIDALEHAGEIMDRLGHGGVLLTTKAGEKVDSMTIGWGFLGIEWGRPVFVALVRTGRFTAEQLAATPEFTVNVPREGSPKRALGYCGSRTGRAGDKLAGAGLTTVPGEVVGAPAIKEFPLTLECRVLYRQLQDADQIPADIRAEMYPQDVPSTNPMANRDYHIMFHGEIVDAYLLGE